MPINLARPSPSPVQNKRRRWRNKAQILSISPLLVRFASYLLDHSMTLHKPIFFWIVEGLMAVGAMLLLATCGTQSSSSFISVTFTPGYVPPTAMNYSEQCGVAATVTSDYKNQGVKWSVACSTATCGTFTSGISGSTVPIVYESPASGGATSVTLTAASVTDPTKFVTSPSIPLGQGSAGCVSP